MTLTECMCALMILLIVFGIISTALVSFFRILDHSSSDLLASAASSQIQMLWEGDLFFRRVSPLVRASSRDGTRHLISFWTRLDQEFKYTVYHFTIGEENRVRSIERYSIRQSDMERDSSGSLKNYVDDTSQGRYIHPYGRLSHPTSLTDLLSDAFLVHKEGMVCFHTGSLQYHLP